MPPIAAPMGSNDLRGVDNSPTRNSRFISSPIVKKKIAIKASLIKSSSVIGEPPWLRLNCPTCKTTGWSQKEK